MHPCEGAGPPPPSPPAPSPQPPAQILPRKQAWVSGRQAGTLGYAQIFFKQKDRGAKPLRRRNAPLLPSRVRLGTNSRAEVARKDCSLPPSSMYFEIMTCLERPSLSANLFVHLFVFLISSKLSSCQRSVFWDDMFCSPSFGCIPICLSIHLPKAILISLWF